MKIKTVIELHDPQGKHVYDLIGETDGEGMVTVGFRTRYIGLDTKLVPMRDVKLALEELTGS